MILRRLYLYVVSAAALVLLATGLTLLGTTVLLFVFNDPTADSNRSQLAIFTAMTVVALPVWGVHFWFARRFAMRDPYERAAALRRLYLYWACLAFAVATLIALGDAIAQFLLPVLDAQTFNSLVASQFTWAAIVFATIFGFHWWTASSDRAAAGEEGTSATLRRWYMYPALLIGLLTMLVAGATVFQIAWTDLALGSAQRYVYLSWPAGLAISGALVWGFHARVVATTHIGEDRHSTLRALEGFLAVAVCMVAALIGASQILYYTLARLLGVSHPGGTSGNVWADAAGPASQLIVFGVAWFLIQRRLARDAASQEADRQAGVRRLYTNLATLVSLAVWAIGAGGLLWNLFEQLEAPVIGVRAGDWKDPVSLWFTLLVVGAAVWVAHWRPSPWAADRQSLSRKLYVWAALLGSILAVLGGGVGMINALLQQLFSSKPTVQAASNLDFGHYLAVIVVAAGVGAYHWRVLRADAAARPARAAAQPPAARPAAVAAKAAEASAQPEVLAPHSRRYTLVVTDATDDDVHQALSSLPPLASYKLTPTEQAVDGR
ncbi:MAG TPA: DUF5671 domain-containing protein [Candidatus Dormibacteraeota bacterium]|nr:DUF5671 domain-containing protein [Candidatus Dormibacteraeota bacterium]